MIKLFWQVTTYARFFYLKTGDISLSFFFFVPFVVRLLLNCRRKMQLWKLNSRILKERQKIKPVKNKIDKVSSLRYIYIYNIYMAGWCQREKINTCKKRKKYFAWFKKKKFLFFFFYIFVNVHNCQCVSPCSACLRFSIFYFVHDWK